jgi:DNA-binding transcriptional ArsR family regulator
MSAQSAALDARFRALADPTRRAIVLRLARGPASVSELAAPHDMGLPAVSKHIGVLEEARIVRRWRDGRVHRVRLEPQALGEAEDWLRSTRLQWERMLDRLEALFEEEKENGKEVKKHGHRARG